MLLAILALLIVIVAGLAVLAIAWHRLSGPQLARRVETALAEATGCDVRVGAARLDLGAAAVLDDVALTCPPGGSVRIATLRARVALLQAVRGRIVVSSVSARGVSVEWNAQQPLPPALAAGGGGDDSRLLPEIVIDDAELRVTHLPRGGEMHLRGVGASAARDGEGAWRVRASTRGSRLAIPGHAFDDVAAEAVLSIAGDTVSVSRLRADIPGALILSRAEGRVRLAGSEMTLDATADVQVEASVAALLAGLPRDRIAGIVAFDGTLRHSPAGGWTIAGVAGSPRLAIGLQRAGSPARQLELHDVAARVEADLGAGSCDLTGLSASACEGKLEADVRIRSPPDGAVISVQGMATGLAWDALPLAPDVIAVAPHLGLFDLEMQLAGPLRDLRRASGGLRVTARPDPDSGLIDGPSRASLRIGDGGIELIDGSLRIARATVSARGHAGWDGALQAVAEAEAPRLDATLLALRAHGVAPQLARMPALRGRAAWTGTLGGTLDAPVATGDLRVDDLTVSGMPMGRIVAPLRLSRDALTIDGATIAGPLADGTISLILPLAPGGKPDDAPGGKPDDTPRGMPDGTWTIARLDLAALAGAFGSPREAGGIASGSGRIVDAEGPALDGILDVAEPSFAGVDAVTARFEGSVSARRLAIRRATAELGSGGTLEASGVMPWSGDGGRLDAGATRVAVPPGAAEPWARVTATARLGGSLDDVRLERAEGIAEDLAVPGLPARSLAFTAIPEGATSLRIEAHDAEAGVSVEGVVATAAPHEAHATIRLDAVELPLSRTDAPDEAPDEAAPRLSLAGLEVVLDGPLRDPALLQWSARAESATAKAGRLELRSEGPLVARQRARVGRSRAGVARSRAGEGSAVVELEPVRFRMTGGDPDGSSVLTVAATIAPAGSAPWSVTIAGPVPLALLSPASDDLRLGGEAELDLRLQGDASDMSWSGHARVRRGYAKLVGFPHALDEIEAEIAFEDHVAELTSSSMIVGGGRVEATGHVEMSGRSIASFALLARGEDVALKLPAGQQLSSLSSFDLAWAGTPASSKVTGAMRVHEATWSKDVNLESAILRHGASHAVGAVRSPLDAIELDLSVSGDDGLFIDNDLARAELHASLDVRGTAARPLLVGSAAMLGEGVLTIRGLSYRLLDASATFTPGHPNDPEIRAQAETEAGGSRVVLSLTGRLSAPRIDLSSDPPLARERLVAMLLSGPGLGASDTIDPEAGTRLGPFSFGKARHLDVIQVDPFAADVSGDRAARLTIGKNLTPRLFAAYSTFLAGAQEQAAELRWRVAGGAVLRLARESDGAVVLEARYVRPPSSRRAAREAATHVGSVTLVGAGGGVGGRGDGDGDGDGDGGGGSEPDAAFWKDVLQLKPGDPADDGDLRRAARAARLEAALRDHPLARVRCASAPVPSDPSARDVTCAVDAGPRVELEIEGLPRGERRSVALAIRDAWTELSGTEQLLPEAVAAARAAVTARGHLDPAIGGSVDEDPSGVVVTLTVDEGTRVRIGEVVVTGTDEVPGDEVEDMLAGRDASLRRPWLTPGSLQAARLHVQGRLVALGHLAAEVGEPAIERGDDPGSARVTLPVTPGPRARVVAIQVSGATRLATEEITREMGAVEGEWLQPLRLDAGARRLEDRYDEEGHPEAAVSWTTAPADGSPAGDAAPILLVVSVREGVPQTIGRIVIRGATVSDEDHLRRVARLKPGGPLRRRDLLAAQARLAGLGTLRRVTVAPDDEQPGASVRDVVVSIEERDRLDLSAGLAWVDERGPRITLKVARRNVLGRAGTIGLDLEAGDTERAEIFTRWRRLFGSAIDASSTAGLREEELAERTTRRVGLSIEGIRDLSGGRSLRARYRIEEVSLLKSEAPEPDFFEGRLATVGLTFTRDTRDDALDPRKGSLSSADLVLGAPAIGSEASYAKLFLQHARALPLTRRLSYAAGIRLGAGTTFGATETIPFSERFFAGGAASVRGFPRDALGPQDALGRSSGGAALLVINQELRLSFGRRWSALLFADAGNVFEETGDMRFGKLATSAGPGVGFATPAGPLRLYVAVPLGPEDDDPRLHLTFGPVF